MRVLTNVSTGIVITNPTPTFSFPVTVGGVSGSSSFFGQATPGGSGSTAGSPQNYGGNGQFDPSGGNAGNFRGSYGGGGGGYTGAGAQPTSGFGQYNCGAGAQGYALPSPINSLLGMTHVGSGGGGGAWASQMTIVYVRVQLCLPIGNVVIVLG